MSTPVQNNLPWADASHRLQAIQNALGTERLTHSPVLRALAPALVALGWMGSTRQLQSHLPAPDHVASPQDLRDGLQAQGFASQTHPWAQWQAHHGGLGGLSVGSVLLARQGALVYVGQVDGQHGWHDGEVLVGDVHPQPSDKLLQVARDPAFVPLDAPQRGWLLDKFYEARSELGGVAVVSLVANLLALAISLFTMFVYNTIIPSGATHTLLPIAVGAVVAIVGAWGLRIARAKTLAQLTAWGASHLGRTTLEKTLGLPLDVSSRLGVENNLVRLRSLESVRQWFGGGGGAINADYPFVVVFLVVIGLLGGWIVLVPVVGLFLFWVASLPLARLVENRSNTSSRASQKLGEWTTVVVRRLRALRGVDAHAVWQRQLPELVAHSVRASQAYARANALAQSVGQLLGMLTVLATMGLGIVLVLDQAMTTGGLIAAMMLIWRVTTPAQQLFVSQVRIKQLGDSTRQLSRLLESVGENANPKATSMVAGLVPSVEADRIYFRYSADREPALSGVSFKLEPGKLLAVVGPNASGKTTLLETLAGLRGTQNGRVMVGGRDIRHFDPADYRAWLGYVPQRIAGLPLTVRESLHLRTGPMPDELLHAALARVAGPAWWAFFDASSAQSALDVAISPWHDDPTAMRVRFIVRLAAALAGSPTLLVLDDPLGDKDPVLDTLLVQLLESLRGTTTVVLATHRPDLIQRCDCIAVLNEGALAHFGPVSPPEKAA